VLHLYSSNVPGQCDQAGAQGAIGAPQAPLIALASSILPARYLSGGLGVLQTAMFLEE